MRIVVVEDEPLARRHLADLLATFPGVQVVAEAAHGREGLAAVAEHRPDAVFLDIEMPGIRGTELMHLLPEPRPALVFVTAYGDHALEAFAGGAVHYLLKPVSYLGVAQALSRIQPKEAPGQKDLLRLPARIRRGTRLLDPGDVEALVADLGDCVAWCRGERLPVEGSLNYWEDRLRDQGFLRVHRSALVRLAAVRELGDDDELVTETGRIKVSRGRMADVRVALGL